MSGTVRSAKKYSEFKSNNHLARELMESYPGVEWGKDFRSLGNKIGELDKGKITWWLNNSEKAKCLADLLEVSLQDLRLHGKVQKGVFGFQEFPEFPPVDLKREEPWALAEEVLDPKQVQAELAAIDHRLDVNTLEKVPAEKLAMNDIAQVTFKLAQPLFADPYLENRGTGAFIIIDESSNNTVGAGMIL